MSTSTMATGAVSAPSSAVMTDALMFQESSPPSVARNTSSHENSMSASEPANPFDIFPIENLPQVIQHHLLSRVQKILEQACFAHASTHHPNVLIENQWLSWEAVEPTTWKPVLQAHDSKLDLQPLRSAQLTLDNLLVGHLRFLRHADVHREVHATSTICVCLQCAVTLARTLKDEQSERLLNDILDSFQERVRRWQATRKEAQQQLTRAVRLIRQDAKQREEELIAGVVAADRCEVEDIFGSLNDVMVAQPVQQTSVVVSEAKGTFQSLHMALIGIAVTICSMWFSIFGLVL